MRCSGMTWSRERSKQRVQYKAYSLRRMPKQVMMFLAGDAGGSGRQLLDICTWLAGRTNAGIMRGKRLR